MISWKKWSREIKRERKKRKGKKEIYIESIGWKELIIIFRTFPFFLVPEIFSTDVWRSRSSWWLMVLRRGYHGQYRLAAIPFLNRVVEGSRLAFLANTGSVKLWSKQFHLCKTWNSFLSYSQYRKKWQNRWNCLKSFSTEIHFPSCWGAVSFEANFDCMLPCRHADTLTLLTSW